MSVAAGCFLLTLLVSIQKCIKTAAGYPVFQEGFNFSDKILEILNTTPEIAQKLSLIHAPVLVHQHISETDKLSQVVQQRV